MTDAAANVTHYAYDTEGNLLNLTDAAGRSTFFTYDAFGRVTQTNFPSTLSENYAYDAENRIISAVNSTSGTSTYVYDALGRRVEKATSVGKIDYIYDLAGNVVTEWYVNYSNYTGWGVSHIYLNGRLVAKYRYGTTQFMHKDHLGSTRLVTGVNQAISDNLDYLPFGEQYSGSSVTSHKFTGKERDSETGLDHTLFRKYSSPLARWTSPDPAGLKAARLAFPRTLNRYVYVLNNPLGFIDPRGLDCVYLNDDGTVSYKSGDCISTMDDGIFVDGTINTSTFNIDPSTGDLTFNYTTDNGTVGVGLVSNAFDPQSLNVGNPGLAMLSQLGGQLSSLGNPCTVGAFYLSSAGGALLFSASSGGAAIFPETKEALEMLAVLYRAAPQEVQQMVQTAAWAAVYASAKVGRACDSLQ